MKKRIRLPENGKLQQGALINCIAVPTYDGCDCHGLVLTARCDLEHEKNTVVNYLPVVRFSDWIHRGMAYLVARRLRKSLDSSITKALRQKGVSEFVRATFPLKEIIMRETIGEEQKRLLTKWDQLKLVDAVLSLNGTFCQDSKELFQVEKGHCESLTKDLIQHKLGEYYFLDTADASKQPDEGRVVLLRYMQTMSCGLMQRIVAGLSQEEANADPEASSQLSFVHDPICMITGVLRSPDIEHLGQHFANLFVRIGVDDYDDTILEHHCNIAKGV